MVKLNAIKKGSIVLFGVMALASLLLASCGAGSGSGRHGSTSSGVAAEYVGVTECYTCHADGLLPQYAGQAIFSSWLNGPHGNYESIDSSHQHIDLGPDNDGFPYYGYSGLGEDADCTTVCHDQLGDGMLLADFALDRGIDSLGRVNRPLVGCESCHGAGGNHFGIGDIPYPNPDASICGQCHNADFDHAAYHPEGDNIYEDYSASPHANSINDHVYEDESETDVTAKCSKCHTDEGAKLYKDVSGGYSELGDLLPSTLPAVADATPVQCRTCHDAHNPGELLLEAGTDALGNTLSAEYRTCTDCHQTEDGYHGENSSHSWTGEEVGIGNFSGARIIYDTHFDDPNTPQRSSRGSVTSGTGGIEGYVLDPSSDRSCRDCHNPHSADTTINEQWANSAHGGMIAQNVDPVTGMVNVTSSGEAWIHYDWKDNGDPADSTDYGRQACQRCHTATGFKNFADDPATYDADGDGYPDTLNEFVATGNQAEMLYCWACHTSNAGDLRDPGVFSGTSPYDTPADRIAAVPDLGGSNICMCCHSGRISGQEVKEATGISGKSFSAFNSHYLATGGVLFRTIGYEFTGADYANYSYFLHDKIGTASGMDTGENGPCAGCHMKSEEGHTFEALQRDSVDTITAISAYAEVCSRCHSSESGLISLLGSMNAGYEEALNALEAALSSVSIYYGGGHPYFFSDPVTQDSTTYYTTWPNNDTLGAAYNFQVLKHVPTAYTHNNLYSKRLIFDSIDFLTNGSLTGTINLSSYPAAAQWYQVDTATSNDSAVVRP